MNLLMFRNVLAVIGSSALIAGCSVGPQFRAAGFEPA